MATGKEYTLKSCDDKVTAKITALTTNDCDKCTKKWTVKKGTTTLKTGTYPSDKTYEISEAGTYTFTSEDNTAKTFSVTVNAYTGNCGPEITIETIKANAYYGYEQQVKIGESNNYPIKMKLNQDTNKWDISCNKIESASNKLISFDVDPSTQITTLHVRVYFLLSDVNQYSELKGLTTSNFKYNGNSIYQVTEYGTNGSTISGFYCYELSVVIGSLDNLSGRIAILIETKNNTFDGTLLDVPINKSYS